MQNPISFQPKYLWYFLLVVVSGGSFFGIYDFPKIWVAARQMLNPLESWWQSHTADPILSAFLVGLVFATVLLPEIWSYTKPRFFPPKPRPDIPAGTAYKTILGESKLAKQLNRTWKLLPGVLYENSKPESQIIKGRVEQQLKTHFHTKFRQGDLKSWGCSIDGTELEEEIQADKWVAMELGLEPRDLESTFVCAWRITPDIRNTRLAFTRVRLCRNELYREFPITWRAWLLRRGF